MKEQLMLYLDDIIALIKSGADFIGVQAPLVVQDMVRYQVVMGLISIGFGILFFDRWGYLIVPWHQKISCLGRTWE